MPQWRKLHLKTIDSVDVNEMPDDFTRLTWVMLPLILDSSGRAIDDSAWLRSKLYPMRRDVTTEQVEAAMVWYATRSMVERYEVGGRRYFSVPTFEKYQGKTDREAISVIPDKPPKKPKNKPPQVKTNSGPTHDQGPDWSCLDVDVDVDKSRGEADESVGAVAPPPKAPEAKPPKKERPQDELFNAIVEVCAVDLSIRGSETPVGTVRAALAGASPPYTADEVRAWAKAQTWMKKPPSVWQLKSGIGSLRKATTNGKRKMTPEEVTAANAALNPTRKGFGAAS